MKLLGQRRMARDFDRQVAEFQVRVAVLNGYTALGIPVTKVVGQVCLGIGEVRPSTDLCNRALSRSKDGPAHFVPIMGLEYPANWEADLSIAYSVRQAKLQKTCGLPKVEY